MGFIVRLYEYSYAAAAARQSVLEVERQRLDEELLQRESEGEKRGRCRI
jgi:hypothetical protein